MERFHLSRRNRELKKTDCDPEAQALEKKKGPAKEGRLSQAFQQDGGGTVDADSVSDHSEEVQCLQGH
jgi:hypothetical protein